MIRIRTIINADGGLLLLFRIPVIEVEMAGERRGGGGMASMIKMVMLNARKDMDMMGKGMGMVMPALSMDTPIKYSLSTSIHMAKLKFTTRILNLLLAHEDEAGEEV